MSPPDDLLIGAERILQLSRGYWASQALFVAVRLGLFALLERGPQGIPELARLLGTDPEATRRLANALVGLGLLSRKEESYENTLLASELLVPGKENYLGHAIHHDENLWPYWEKLDQAIRMGNPVAFEVMEKGSYDYGHRLEDYLLAMRDHASLLTPQIVQAFDLTGCRHLLDLGGGPGVYAQAFARYHPELRVTLYDLDAVIEVVERWIEPDLRGDRVHTCRGNFLEGDWPPADAIFLSQVIHIYDAPIVRQLIEKAHDTLTPKGRIAIHDYLLQADGFVPSAGSLFALNMFLGTPKGACYPAAELAGWLSEAGFEEIRELPISPSTSLILGKKGR